MRPQPKIDHRCKDSQGCDFCAIFQMRSPDGAERNPGFRQSAPDSGVDVELACRNHAIPGRASGLRSLPSYRLLEAVFRVSLASRQSLVACSSIPESMRRLLVGRHWCICSNASCECAILGFNRMEFDVLGLQIRVASAGPPLSPCKCGRSVLSSQEHEKVITASYRGFNSFVIAVIVVEQCSQPLAPNSDCIFRPQYLFRVEKRSHLCERRDYQHRRYEAVQSADANRREDLVAINHRIEAHFRITDAERHVPDSLTNILCDATVLTRSAHGKFRSKKRTVQL